MNHKERMEANLPYLTGRDGLPALRLANRKRLFAFNHLPPEDTAGAAALLQDILGRCGSDVYIAGPFHCDYGYNIELGDHFYGNFNLVIVDVAKVRIGDNAQIAPNVGIYTAGHPLHPDTRNTGYEYGLDITIGNSVWIGGNAVILPGVTIGDNVVVSAGSVVNRDLPDNVIAVGNPCRIVRTITEADRDFYYRNRRFDADTY